MHISWYGLFCSLVRSYFYSQGRSRPIIHIVVFRHPWTSAMYAHTVHDPDLSWLSAWKFLWSRVIVCSCVQLNAQCVANKCKDGHACSDRFSIISKCTYTWTCLIACQGLNLFSFVLIHLVFLTPRVALIYVYYKLYNTINTLPFTFGVMSRNLFEEKYVVLGPQGRASKAFCMCITM